MVVGQSGTSTLPLEFPSSEQIWRSSFGEANHSFQREASKHRLVGCIYLPEGGLLVPLPVNSASRLGEKWFLEIFFQGLFQRSWSRARRPTRTEEGKTTWTSLCSVGEL